MDDCNNCFLLLRATPGDPTDAILGTRAPEAAKEALREELGLNAPLWVQYFKYLGQVLSFDLGSSLTSRGESVWQVIQQYFPATVELAFFAILVAIAIGMTVGIISSLRPNTIWDLGGRLFGIITYSLPLFWVGMIMQLVFAVQLRWFPLGTRFPIGLDTPNKITGLYTIDSLLSFNGHQFSTSIHYLVLPCFTLGILLSGIFERIVRVNLKKLYKLNTWKRQGREESKKEKYFSHAFKNALIPVITVMGLTFAALLGGAVLTEVTFSWPGLGNRLYEAISLRDYPTVQGIMVFFWNHRCFCQYYY